MARGAKCAAVNTDPVEGPWELPDGWRWRRLGDVFPLSYGKSLPLRDRRTTGSVPVYGSSGRVGFHTAALTDGPAVLVGRKGSAGSVHFSEEPCWPIDTAYFVEAGSSLDLRYGFYLLRHIRLGSLDQSTAIPSLSRDTYSDQIVPVAPDGLQRQIAARIDALFDEIEEGEGALELVRTGIATYRDALIASAMAGHLTEDWRSERLQTGSPEGAQQIQAALQVSDGGRRAVHRSAAVQGPRELPAGWNWVSVAQLGEVVTGSTPPSVARDSFGGGLPFFTPGDLSHGQHVSQTKRTLTKAGLTKVRAIPSGSVMVTCIGATIGKTSLSTVDGSTNQQINSIVPYEPALAEFLLAYFSGPQGRASVIEASSSTTMPILNKGDFSRLPVPLPPLDEVNEIVRRLRNQRSLEEEAATVVAGAAAASTSLRQSIFAAAFRGDLVA